MADLLLPALYALMLWWFSTGAIAWADGLPRRTFVVTQGVATGFAAVGFWVLAQTADDGSVFGAFAAFTAAVIIWGWNETAFLLGLLTGPRTGACPPGAVGFRRFTAALQAVLWHELAVLAAGLAVFAATWDAPNQTGAMTYGLLWIMRVSAKLNVFLGVPNLGEAFLPPHLLHLLTYLRRRPINALFPLSVTGTTILVVWLGDVALGAEDPAIAASFALLAALAALALLEHWFMVLPLPATGLWAWYLGSRAKPGVPTHPPSARTPAPRAALAPSTIGGVHEL